MSDRKDKNSRSKDSRRKGADLQGTENGDGELRGKSTSDFYRLNSDAVERLVTADESNSEEVSEDEIARVSGRKKFYIPNLVKVLFIKWWFYGAICFFFYFGLGTYLSDTMDQLFILGAAMGILTDLLTNHLLRFIEKTDHTNDRYMFIRSRKFWSIFLNVIYGYVILYCVVYLYNLINVIILSITGAEDTIPLPVEPLLFGVICLAFDMLFIGIKNLCIRIFRDAASKTPKSSSASKKD